MIVLFHYFSLPSKPQITFEFYYLAQKHPLKQKDLATDSI